MFFPESFSIVQKLKTTLQLFARCQNFFRPPRIPRRSCCDARRRISPDSRASEIHLGSPRFLPLCRKSHIRVILESYQACHHLIQPPQTVHFLFCIYTCEHRSHVIHTMWFTRFNKRRPLHRPLQSMQMLFSMFQIVPNGSKQFQTVRLLFECSLQSIAVG